MKLFIWNQLVKKNLFKLETWESMDFTYFSTAITMGTIVVSLVLFFIQNRDTAEYGLSLEDLGTIETVHGKSKLLGVLLFFMLLLSFLRIIISSIITTKVKYIVDVLSFLMLFFVFFITICLVKFLKQLSTDNIKKNTAEKILDEAKQWKEKDIGEEIKKSRIINKVILNAYLYPDTVRETLQVLYEKLISDIIYEDKKIQNRICKENLFFLAYIVTLVFCDTKDLKAIQQKKTLELLEGILYKIKRFWNSSELIQYLLIGILTGFLNANEGKECTLNFLDDSFDYDTYNYDEDNEFFSMIIIYFVFLAEFHINLEQRNVTLFYYLEHYSAKWNRDSIVAYMSKNFFDKGDISKTIFYFWGIIYKNIVCMVETFERLKEELKYIDEGKISVYLMTQIKEKL